MKKSKKYWRFTWLTVIFCLTVKPLFAAELPLVDGVGPVVITAKDVQLDVVNRVPAENRNALLSQPESVGRIAMNLYVRKVMADQAMAANLESNPDITNSMKLARDKVLSDAWLARIDAENTIPRNVLERLAKNAYLAKPEKFKLEEQIQAAHILIKDSSVNGRAMAEKTLAELKAGADFAALAKERSGDVGTALEGGDLGYFSRGTMVKEFEQVAFAMQKPNELSGIVQTKFGFHLIKLIDRREARTLPFEEVKEQLMNEVQQSAHQRARAEAAQRIEAQSKVNKQAILDFVAAQKEKP